MIFYSLFVGTGRGILAEVLGAEDPFALSGAEIVERVLAAGHTPVVDQPRREPFPTYGRTEEVEREGLTYIVAVSRDGESISVQEMRADEYEREE